MGWLCGIVCSSTCGPCIVSLLSPEPFSKVLCIACGVCIGLCFGAPSAICAVACAVDPCAHGHVCRPGTIRNKHCADYSNGYYHTLVWEKCNNIGMEWETHYDYCGARGLICDPSSLVCTSSGGGGCPFLYVYDGNEYLGETYLNIHDITGVDVQAFHIVENNPESINNRFIFKLREHPVTISHIDNVILYAKMPNGRLTILPLMSGIHSSLGDVTELLRYSDDIRVEELGAEHNNGISEEIILEFLGPKYMPYIEFIFFIEGNNYIIK